MKQRITPEDLSQLSDEQKRKLRDWWKPKLGDMCVQFSEFGTTKIILEGNLVRVREDGEIFGKCGHQYENPLPLLSIGQMIELLGEEWQRKIYCSSMHDCGVYKNINYWKDDELVNALWEAVKQIL